MTTTRFKWRALLACGAVLAVALGAVPAVLASVVKSLSLEELTRKADLIVVGVGAEAQARRNDDGRLIVTDVSVDVQQVLKGDAKAGDDVIVTLLGGTLDGLGLRVPGEASIPIGQPALLFLYRSGSASGTAPALRGGARRDLRVVGMAQGVMTMQDQRGTMVIIPGGSGSHLVERDNAGQLKDAPAALLRPEAADKLLARVRALVGAAK